MNPLSRIVLLFSVLLLISFYYDPYYVAATGIVAGAVYLIARVPKKWILITVPAMAYRFWEFLIVGLGQYDATLFKVWPQSFVSQVVFVVPVPFVGRIPMIVGGLMWTIAQTFHIVIVAAITFTLVYSTSLNDYINIMRRFKFPYQIIYVVTVALKFVPDIFRTYGTIAKAQRLRGWQVKTRNPIKAARLALPLITPLSSQIMFYVDRLTISSQIRGFGATKVHYDVHLGLKPKDYSLILIILAIDAFALYMLIFHNAGLL
jgi:energy-coupling factor transporter transmembrane protein EcfT